MQAAILARESLNSKRARESISYTLEPATKRPTPATGQLFHSHHSSSVTTAMEEEAKTDVNTVSLPGVAELISESLFNKPQHLSTSSQHHPTLPQELHSLVSSLCNPLKGLIIQESQLRDVCLSLRESLVHGRVPKSLSVSNRLELPASTLQHWLPTFLDLKKRFEQDALYILLWAKLEEFAQLQTTIGSFSDTVITTVRSAFKIPPSAEPLVNSIQSTIAYNTYMSWLSFCITTQKQIDKKKLVKPITPNTLSTETTVVKIVKAALSKELASLNLSNTQQTSHSTPIAAQNKPKNPTSKPGKKDTTPKPPPSKRRQPNNHADKVKPAQLVNSREKQPPKPKMP